jgi:phosphate acetyltransferase
MELLKQAERMAKKQPARIVFPEGEEPRIIETARILAKKKYAFPILIGRPQAILRTWKYADRYPSEIIDHHKSELQDEYLDTLFALRKKKGLTKHAASRLLSTPNYFGVMMVYQGHADGMVSGSTHTTAETVRPALQIIKTKKKYHRVSGLFIMLWNHQAYFFADCAIIPQPTGKDLAEIALDSAHHARLWGVTPKVAFLSYTTYGSADNPSTKKIRQALRIIKRKEPSLLADGELQLDAAIIPNVARIKCPKSPLKGNANVLIFPDLESGNMAYKFVERFGGATAIGPILQGLKKPVNDVSRGSTVEDIVDTAILTGIEAKYGEKN